MDSFCHIDGSTALYGLVGNSIKNSLSPAIHNAGFRFFNLNAVYIPLEIKEGSNRIEILRSITSLAYCSRLSGFNVTMPFKSDIVPFIDKTDDSVVLTGAVNTVCEKSGILYGYNTDVAGFISGLRKAEITVQDSNALVIGAGGAARAVIAALKMEKVASITVANRDIKRLTSLQAEESFIPNKHTKAKLKFTLIRDISLRDYDLVVNATPIGMHGYPAGHDGLDIRFQKNQIFYDLVYSSHETPLIQLAKREGAITIDGLTMLVEQAALSFQIWTGKKPESDFLYSVAMRAMGGS